MRILTMFIALATLRPDSTSVMMAGIHYALPEEYTTMDIDEYANGLLIKLFAQAHAQFGNAIQLHWFYGSDFCPGCGHTIDAIKVKGENALSLNAYIYRKRHVLIGYLLCSRCATKVFAASRKHPGIQSPLHAVIERNLAAAYNLHMASLDA